MIVSVYADFVEWLHDESSHEAIRRAMKQGQSICIKNVLLCISLMHN
jgi:hypothetical protein